MDGKRHTNQETVPGDRMAAAKDTSGHRVYPNEVVCEEWQGSVLGRRSACSIPGCPASLSLARASVPLGRKCCPSFSTSQFFLLFPPLVRDQLLQNLPRKLGLPEPFQSPCPEHTARFLCTFQPSHQFLGLSTQISRSLRSGENTFRFFFELAQLLKTRLRRGAGEFADGISPPFPPFPPISALAKQRGKCSQTPFSGPGNILLLLRNMNSYEIYDNVLVSPVEC